MNLYDAQGHRKYLTAPAARPGISSPRLLPLRHQPPGLARGVARDERRVMLEREAFPTSIGIPMDPYVCYTSAWCLWAPALTAGLDLWLPNHGQAGGLHVTFV